MSLNLIDNRDGYFVSLPVFRGLDKLGQNGQKIAEIVGVSPPTVSKWRNGHVAIPDEIVALLTLVLASFVEDVLGQESDNSESQAWQFYQKTDFLAARKDLSAQEKINHQLQPIAVRAGAIKFRYWWNKHFRAQISELATSGRQAEHAVSVL